MTLQEKIFYCRKKEGLSQELLAEKIGVSRQAISKWETGEATPEVGKLLLLAKAFNVTTDWLLSEEGPKEKNNNVYENEGDCYNEQSNDYNNQKINKPLPSIIMKLIAKSSWMAGIYVAMVGFLIVLIGSGFCYLGNTMMNSLDEASNQMINDFYGSSYDFENQEDIVIDEEWEGLFKDIEDPVPEEDFFNVGTEKRTSMSSPMRTIANVFSGIMILVGAIILFGGIILAVYLRKNGKEFCDAYKQNI